jgi:hypothetical protein
MNTTFQPNHTRALGWYAIRWMHVTDWFKGHTQRRQGSGRQPLPQPTAKMPQPEMTAATPTATPQAQEAEENGETEIAKLQQVVDESQNILVQTQTVFPFTPFPTKVTIDRHKLTIVYRKFFNVEQRVSVPIEDVKNIQADVGPFLGSLTITSDLFINNTQQINYLPRREVKEIQKLVQGAMVALKEGVNLTKIDCQQLKKLLSDLGEGHTNEAVTT